VMLSAYRSKQVDICSMNSVVIPVETDIALHSRYLSR
jgi:hypothetical protein